MRWLGSELFSLGPSIKNGQEGRGGLDQGETLGGVRLVGLDRGERGDPEEEKVGGWRRLGGWDISLIFRVGLLYSKRNLGRG